MQAQILNWSHLDLISQAEHSKDTMCFVITQSKTMAKQIQKSIEKLIPGTERSSIIKESISKNGFIAVCKNQNEVIELANKIAPEHLELMVKKCQNSFKKDYRRRFSANRKKHTICCKRLHSWYQSHTSN